MTKALIIFARAPVIGRTKTRLIPALGAEGALQAHQELVERALERLRLMPGTVVRLAISEPSEIAESWAERFSLPLVTQRGDDLGRRMYQALRDALDDGFERAVLVGTDCPTIDRDYVEAGFERLSTSDLVIGPAQDGGYGLIGGTRVVPELFEAIDWGTERVLAQTRAAANRCGFELEELETIWDVDTPADWQRYLRFVGRLRD
jgi:rSAM/selenodomain-associated transferase 1